MNYNQQHLKLCEQSDRQVCAMGPEYCRGGMEYYDRMLQRHLALRELMPDGKGKKLFNAVGNLNEGLIWNKYMPISSRKAICEEVLKKICF